MELVCVGIGGWTGAAYVMQEAEFFQTTQEEKNIDIWKHREPGLFEWEDPEELQVHHNYINTMGWMDFSQD